MFVSVSELMIWYSVWDDIGFRPESVDVVNGPYGMMPISPGLNIMTQF